MGVISGNRSGAPFLLDALQQDPPLGPWVVAVPQLLPSVNEQSAESLEMLIGFLISCESGSKLPSGFSRFVMLAQSCVN